VSEVLLFFCGFMTGVILCSLCAHLAIRHQEVEKARYEELGKMLEHARAGKT